MKSLRSRRTLRIQISSIRVITVLPGSIEVNGTRRQADLTNISETTGRSRYPLVVTLMHAERAGYPPAISLLAAVENETGLDHYRYNRVCFSQAAAIFRKPSSC